MAVVVGTCLGAAAACAPKLIPAPAVDTPKFPEFVAPVVPPAANPAAAVTEDRGWRFLQAGDLENAEREFATALRVAPDFMAAEISLATAAGTSRCG